MRSSSVATMTSETKRARDARSTTCIIIGIPARGRRDLPGNRVDEYRAGMIATASPFTGFQPSPSMDRCQTRQRMAHELSPESLFWMSNNIDEVVSVGNDAKVEAPVPSNSGLPDIPRLIILLSTQRWMARIFQ